MRYFIMNRQSPHAFMWIESKGDLRYAGPLCPANLIGIKFEKSVIDGAVREKILKKYPDLVIPPPDVEIIKTSDGNGGYQERKQIKHITDVQIGEHIVCIYPASRKFIPADKWAEEELAIDDYVVVSQQK